MPIAITCKCGKKFQTKDENAGKKSRCVACGETLLIPTPSKEDDLFELVVDEPAPQKKKPIAPPDETDAPPPSARRTVPPVMGFPSSSHRPKLDDRTFHFGGGLVTFTIAALVIVGITIFVIKQGPVKTQKVWREMAPKAEGDVETVISFSLRGYYASKGANAGTFKRIPQANSAIFDEPLLMFRIPESIPVQGNTSLGKYHGTFHPHTGELEAEIHLEMEDVKIQITGRVKDGQTTAELSGVPLKDLPPSGQSGPSR